MRSLSRRVACLCLLLTLGSAMAFVAHHHSSATDAVKCTVCVTVHSAAPKTGSYLQNASFIRVSTFRPVPVSVKQRLVTFALSVRPPPQA
jgi:hypothetical protein